MLIGFWHEWGSTIEWGVAAFGGWWAKVAATRIQAQRNTIDATKAETEQMKLSLDRERSLTERVLQYAAETQESWRILYLREAVLIEYHAAAIGARLRVHELEAQQGLPTTKFDPLPGYPPVSVNARNILLTSPDAYAVARDQAESTTDPGAYTPVGQTARSTVPAAGGRFKQPLDPS